LDYKFPLNNEDKNLYNWNSAVGEKAVSVLPILFVILMFYS